MNEKQATLIQCTNKKRNHSAPAKEMYMPSPYFQKMRKWASLRPGRQYVISAKHGLLAFDTEIEPYNVRGVSQSTANAVVSELTDRNVQSVTVCLGYHDYLKPLQPALDKAGITVTDPFQKMKIGERLSALDAKIRELENEQLC